MGAKEHRKAIEQMSQAWRRLTERGRVNLTVPAPAGGEEGAREGGKTPPQPPESPKTPPG